MLRGLGSLLHNKNVIKVIVEINDTHLARFNSEKENIYMLMSDAGFKAKHHENKGHYDEVFFR